jgi:predicted outer membrane repeat protein
MPTIAEAVAAGEQALFVGRANEVQVFERWLSSDPLPPEVLEVSGPGGIGKTSLLAAFRRVAQGRGRTVVEVDMRGAAGNAAALLESLGGSDPDSAVAHLNAVCPLLLLDTFEEAGDLQRLLAEDLLPRLDTAVRVVIAGRFRLGHVWRAERLGRVGLRSLSLSGLPADASRAYLERRGVGDARLVDQILRSVGGHPRGATCTEAGLNAALAGGGSITFNCGGPVTITITRTKSIAANTSVDGGGQVTFSGGGSTGSQFRLFEVRPGVTLSLSNLTLRDAFVPTEGGGAIRNQGALNVTHVTFLNNVAASGGAILTFGSAAAVHVTNSTFSNNSADTPQVGGSGGAIDQRDGQVTISGSTFAGNHAQRGGDGGAIHTFSLGHLSVTTSSFTNNVAHFSGGAIASGNAMALNGSTLTGNTASDGGALWSGGTGSAVSGSTIRANRATDDGGGIMTGGGTLAVTRSTLDGNTAAQFGGGIENTFTSLTVSNSRITSNRAGADGGGINTSNQLAIDHTTLSGNVATGNGGGVAQKAFGLRNTITASTLSGNRAGNSGGALMTVAGSIFTYDTTIANNTAQRGGAAALGANMGFSNTTIAHNTASFTTGGVYNPAQFQAVFFNTIIANNTVGTRSQNCNSAEPTLGYNLDSDGTCRLTRRTDINRVDPKLGPLQKNGGPTQTMLPAAGSRAINAGGPSTPEPQFGFRCLATDQRGARRPQGRACDIGAVETATP